MKNRETKIYLDYAASTPVDLGVERAMRPYFTNIFGNPGSIHGFGQKASAAVFEARQKIAKALGVKYDEVIFTGSATEANNLALRGVIGGLGLAVSISSRQKLNDQLTKTLNDIDRCNQNLKPKLIISAIEHESILETARDLEKYGIKVSCIPVDKNGVIRLDVLRKELDENTVLVSVMYANNEIGAIQPIKEITKIINDFKTQYPNSKIKFHTDAVQALQFLDCNVEVVGVDLMTISAHKIYGPKGIGCLIGSIRHISPVVTGGGQEFGFRSGTENVPYIVGFGEAVELVEGQKSKEFKRLSSLKNFFWKQIKKIFPKAELNGSLDSSLPNILNIYIPGTSAQDRCIELDLKGVAVSPGVACAARSASPSYVVAALRHSSDRPSSSLRFSFGRQTTKQELDLAIEILGQLKS